MLVQSAPYKLTLLYASWMGYGSVSESDQTTLVTIIVIIWCRIIMACHDVRNQICARASSLCDNRDDVT